MSVNLGYQRRVSQEVFEGSSALLSWSARTLFSPHLVPAKTSFLPGGVAFLGRYSEATNQFPYDFCSCSVHSFTVGVKVLDLGGSEVNVQPFVAPFST